MSKAGPAELQRRIDIVKGQIVEALGELRILSRPWVPQLREVYEAEKTLHRALRELDMAKMTISFWGPDDCPEKDGKR